MDSNGVLHLGKPYGVMSKFLPNLPIVMRQRILTKGLAYLSSASRYVQQEIGKQDLNTAAKIVENFENPKETELAFSEYVVQKKSGGDGARWRRNAMHIREKGALPP